MNNNEMRFVNVNWMHLAQNCVYRRHVLNTAMKLQFRLKLEERAFGYVSNWYILKK
jgi:hypothetical protein